jgi:hypothetical protein
MARHFSVVARTGAKAWLPRRLLADHEQQCDGSRSADEGARRFRDQAVSAA